MYFYNLSIYFCATEFSELDTTFIAQEQILFKKKKNKSIFLSCRVSLNIIIAYYKTLSFLSEKSVIEIHILLA